MGEVEPAEHTRQVVATVAPTVVEYVPTPQSVHTALPVAILYFPATHAVHGPPIGPVDPALHVQAARTELEIGELEFVGHAMHVVAIVAPTVVEYVPAPQSVQTALPVEILYFPVTHAVHAPPPFSPVNPALQMHSKTLVLALGDVLLTGHVVHAALPTVFFHVPAAHAVHDPSGPVYPGLQGWGQVNHQLKAIPS